MPHYLSSCSSALVCVALVVSGLATPRWGFPHTPRRGQSFPLPSSPGWTPPLPHGALHPQTRHGAALPDFHTHHHLHLWRRMHSLPGEQAVHRQAPGWMKCLVFNILSTGMGAPCSHPLPRKYPPSIFEILPSAVFPSPSISFINRHSVSIWLRYSH